MPADVNLASAGFFCVPARRYGHSLGKLHPTLHHRREQDVGSPARTVVIDPKEPDTPAGICHPLRAHSPNRSTGGPLSTRRSGDRLHLSDISGGSVRSQERSRGKRAGRSEKQGAFVGKCGESHGKRGAFSRLCGIRSAHKPSPCDDRAGKKKRSALFLQRKRADRSFIGTLRTTAADSRER